MDTGTGILDRIVSGELLLPPAEFRVVATEAEVAGGMRADAVIEVCLENETFRFVAEVKTMATPRQLQQAIAIARQAANPPETYPLVIVPYLSPGKLDQLVVEEVSGVDLCGNGALIVPGRMLILRSGNPNQFPASTKIKNVYRGKNSLVARAFLIRPEFSRVKDIVELLKRRGGEVAFSTVSKALRRLEEDLVISREGKSIRLLQADVLLDRLVANYEPPAIRKRYRAKCVLDATEVVQRLASAVERQGDRAVLTGAASAEQYAALAREPVVSLYTSAEPASLLDAGSVEAKQTDRFPNLEILQTADAGVFFDTRCENSQPFASPIQTYLELATGDKRQKDVAEQVIRAYMCTTEECHVIPDSKYCRGSSPSRT